VTGASNTRVIDAYNRKFSLKFFLGFINNLCAYELLIVQPMADFRDKGLYGHLPRSI